MLLVVNTIARRQAFGLLVPMLHADVLVTPMVPVTAYQALL